MVRSYRPLAVCFAAMLATCAISTARAAPAVNEPAGINLGGTSFFDGFGGTKPGFVYQQYFQYEHFNAVNDANGNPVPVFKGTSINAIISLNQLIYVTPIHLFGGTLGFTGLLPIVHLHTSFAADSPATLSADNGALGDLTAGPFLQFPPVFRHGRPVFDMRFEFDTLFPIGSYNRHRDINPSAGFWSINPYWAMTVLPTPKLEFSARLNYLHNFVNSDPASSAPVLPGTTTQAGDAGWVNFDASYEVAHGLHLGINGYYFRQFTANRLDNVDLPHSLTTNLSIGPGLMYKADKRNIFFANAYLPVIERNTTSGFHLVFRWIHIF